MAPIQYFAYGSNMLAERLRARCPSAKSRWVASADNFELSFCKKSRDDGSGKATLSSRPDGGCRVFGVIFDLDEGELSELDRAEGAGKGYDRVDDFQVHIAGCREPLRAITYIANVASIDPDIKPYDWYLSLVVAGARQNLLPLQYTEAIEAMPSIHDPKPKRKARLEALELMATSRMPLPDDTRIAGEMTVRDWKAIKGPMIGYNDPEIWKVVFKVFFKARLESRYFEPIRAIEKMGQDVGEGFAIVTLHCSLIEFLAATLEGKTYRHGKKDLGTFEYSYSRDMFVSFLEKNEPFKAMFSNKGTAEDFYASFRCGLLHEARTKGTWKIRVRESAIPAIDANAKIVYRNKMQAAFDQFVEWYGRRLSTDADLQQAFIRKFDSLCEE